MASEWAKQKATKMVDGVAFDEGCIEECISDIANALDAARAQGRREGLEEAAKVADGHEDHLGFEHDSQRDACVQYIAAEIRALIAQEPTA